MIFFWLVTFLLLLIATLGLLWPFLFKDKKESNLTRSELNQRFYRMRLSELSKERELGMVDQEKELTADLQHSLLDDIPKGEEEGLEKEKEKLENEKKLHLDTVLILLIVLLCIITYSSYFFAGSANRVNNWVNVLKQTPVLSQKLRNTLQSKESRLTIDDISQLKLIIRTQLQKDKNDIQGWLMLSNLAEQDKDFETYLKAAERAYSLDPNNTMAQKSYGQALLESDDKNENRLGTELLNTYLLNNKIDLNILSRLAFYNFQAQEYELAIRYWKQMLPELDPNSQRYQMVQKGIETAKSKLPL